MDSSRRAPAPAAFVPALPVLAAQHSAVLQHAAPCRAATATRTAPVAMAGGKKKARRGARKVQTQETESSNAVDVFAGADVDPDALLAAAMAKPVKPTKKGKKGKKLREEEDGESGPDQVMEAPSIAPEADAQQDDSRAHSDILGAETGKNGQAQGKEKNTSKKKNAFVMESDEDNSMDDGLGAQRGSNSDALLAAAVAVPEKPLSKKQARKMASSNKKGGVVDDGSNAVEVLPTSAGGSPEDLLAVAMAVPEKPISKKEARRRAGGNKKSSIVEDELNAVNVPPAGNVASPEDLPAAAMSQPENPSSKEAVKGGKNSTLSEDSTSIASNLPLDSSVGTKPNTSNNSFEAPVSAEAVDVETPLSKKEARKLASGKATPINVATKAEMAGKDAVLRAQSLGVVGDETAEKEASLDSPEAQAPNVTQVEEEDDDFEPDDDIVSEFETISGDVQNFTLAGRRNQAKASLGKRNAAEETQLGDAKRASYGSGGEKFTSIRLEDVGMVFRNTPVLNSVTWGVKTGDRIGLVGPNGCGKSTQLKIIAGQLTPTSGEVLRSSSRTRAAFLRQEFVDELDPTRTLREEFQTAFKEAQQALNLYKKTEDEIDAAGDDLSKLDDLLNALEASRRKCDELDAWNIDARIDKIMPGLGFREDDNDMLVASFSGGWKVRIGIGKVLMQDPDVLLLDEPSNHLDLSSVEWLEEYLQNCELPMVIVSHDREFMNRVCNKIIDIDGGEAFEYPGNYSRFVKLKAERRKSWEAAYEKQSKFIKEQQQYIKQNRGSAARSKQIKSREKMLQRMERTGQLVRQPPRGGKPLVFRFPPAPRSARDVVVMEDVTHGYQGRQLFKDVNFVIERGDRLAIVGPNGCGKSTLLRLIAGTEQPNSGSLESSELHNVKIAYFEQNQADALDLTITVLDTMRGAAPSDMRYEEIRALLGKFLFKGDAVDKKVSALSGGEKARLALAKMMLEPASLYLLDEPSNHISVEAQAMLEEALQNYDGTLVVVSHDRYFISQVATQILSVQDKDLVLHDGDYKSFMEKDKNLKAIAESRFVDGVQGIQSAPDVSIEETITELEKKQKRKKNFGGSGVGSGRTKEMNAKRWGKQ